jgi:hypothetical protein
MAVARTERTEDGTVGIPDNSDSIMDREAASEDAEASAAERSDGELPSSVVVVAAAWGIGSASARAAMPKRIMRLQNILTTYRFLETE